AAQSSENNLIFRLKHAIQLSSNKALPDSELDQLLKSFLNANQLNIVKTVCSIDSMTARAFAESVLCTAVRAREGSEYTELVQHLLATGIARPDLPSTGYGTLFCDAISNVKSEEDISIIKCFLDAGVDIEKGTPYTPMNTALWTLQNDKAYEVVSLLIHRGATTNGRSSPS